MVWVLMCGLQRVVCNTKVSGSSHGHNRIYTVIGAVFYLK